MNKTIKRKLIGTVVCLVLGIIFCVYPTINYKIFTDELHSYMSGFGGGLVGVGIYNLVICLKAIKNPVKAKEIENEMKDERVKSNSNYAMAIAFRISMFAEAIISIICAISQKIEISKYMGFAICFQLVLYIIVYCEVNKKN